MLLAAPELEGALDPEVLPEVPPEVLPLVPPAALPLPESPLFEVSLDEDGVVVEDAPEAEDEGVEDVLSEPPLDEGVEDVPLALVDGGVEVVPDEVEEDEDGEVGLVVPPMLEPPVVELLDDAPVALLRSTSSPQP